MREGSKCSSASGVGRRQFIGRKECSYFILFFVLDKD
jgi:hypothetical protein